MELSQILSWVGTGTGVLIGIPQLVKTVRTKKVGDLSTTMFILILVTCACFSDTGNCHQGNGVYFLLCLSDHH